MVNFMCEYFKIKNKHYISKIYEYISGAVKTAITKVTTTTLEYIIQNYNIESYL